jgi:DNA-binding transcriptional LysR family regulator
MAEFHRKQSLARFMVRAGSSDVVEQWVEAGEVDIGLTYASRCSEAVETCFATRMPTEALCRADHVLARLASLSLADVLDYPLAISERDAIVRKLFEAVCAVEGKLFEPLLVSGNAAVIAQFVSSTNGIAVGNRAMLKGWSGEGEMVAIRIDEPALDDRQLQLITMHGRRMPAMVNQFLQALKTALNCDNDAA